MPRRRSSGTGLGQFGRQPEVTQDALNHRRVFDQRDECESPATPGTGEHIQAQGASFILHLA